LSGGLFVEVALPTLVRIYTAGLKAEPWSTLAFVGLRNRG